MIETGILLKWCTGTPPGRYAVEGNYRLAYAPEAPDDEAVEFVTVPFSVFVDTDVDPDRFLDLIERRLHGVLEQQSMEIQLEAARQALANDEMLSSAIEDRGFRYAVKLWTQYYIAAETLDRFGPHSPEVAPGRGVNLIPGRKDNPGVRAARELIKVTHRALGWVPKEVDREARDQALIAAERWCRANPCPCSWCVSERGSL